jgi:hypothetical protein
MSHDAQWPPDLSEIAAGVRSHDLQVLPNSGAMAAIGRPVASYCSQIFL